MTVAPNQFGRKIGLVVSAGTTGLDLSQMQIRFQTQQADQSAPNTALIRIYNLKDSTALQIQNEFQTVALQAGYENGNFALIFNGQIMQVKRGRETAIDSYVDIMASDGDLFHNFGFVNKSLAASNTSAPNQYAQILAVAQGLGVQNSPNSNNALAATGGILPRGKVLFGLARARMDNLAASQSASWTIKDGQLTITPMKGIDPGTAVVLNSRTGMINIPEATNQGVDVTCLLNPLIKIGTQVKIDNKDINQTTQRTFGGFYPGYTDFNAFASIANDGLYRVLVVEHSGDIRGHYWYSHLICLNLDSSAPQGQQVRAY